MKNTQEQEKTQNTNDRECDRDSDRESDRESDHANADMVLLSDSSHNNVICTISQTNMSKETAQAYNGYLDMMIKEKEMLSQLQKIRLAYQFDAHRHITENLMIVAFLLGAIGVSVESYNNFSMIIENNDKLYQWSVFKADEVSTYFTQLDENYIVMWILNTLSFGVSIPFHVVSFTSLLILCISKLGAVFTSYVLFMTLCFFSVVLVRVYTSGCLFYIPGFGIDCRKQMRLK